MFTFDLNTLQFFNVTANRVVESVKVTKTRTGRYQYREATKGRLLASGVSPTEFAKKFWFATEVTEVGK